MYLFLTSFSFCQSISFCTTSSTALDQSAVSFRRSSRRASLASDDWLSWLRRRVLTSESPEHLNKHNSPSQEFKLWRHTNGYFHCSCTSAVPPPAWWGCSPACRCAHPAAPSVKCTALMWRSRISRKTQECCSSHLSDPQLSLLTKRLLLQSLTASPVLQHLTCMNTYQWETVWTDNDWSS